MRRRAPGRPRGPSHRSSAGPSALPSTGSPGPSRCNPRSAKAWPLRTTARDRSDNRPPSLRAHRIARRSRPRGECRAAKTAMRRCGMPSASPVESLVANTPLPVGSSADPRPTPRRGIAALAARLHAATYELLVLLREFDARNGWNNGFLSCAHWLHWRTGIDLGAAREKVRVAKALAALPRISASMQRGQISYAKVRALTRVATPENEARCSTCAGRHGAHVERLVRGLAARGPPGRGPGDGDAASESSARHVGGRRRHGRHPRTAHARGGRRGAARARGGGRPAVPRCGRVATAGSRGGGTVTSAQRRADALGLLAEAALAAEFDRGTAGDRYQVVLHVSADERRPPIDREADAARWTRRRHRLRRRARSGRRGAFTFPRKRRAASPATPRSCG